MSSTKNSARGLAAAICILTLTSCNRSNETDEPPSSSNVNIDVNARRPAKLLSEYGLFEDLRSQAPSSGVIPYEVNTAHFADYARSRHFLYLPPHSTIGYQEKAILNFPLGSVLIQTLSYWKDRRDESKGERLVETRLLIHQKKGWVGVPYLWNEAQDDARRAVAGDKTPVAWTHDDGAQRTLDFVTPNMNQCKQCHIHQESMVPIGVTAANLHRENQLESWVDSGLLNGAPSDLSKTEALPIWNTPDTGTVAERARAWLDVNCAHCHNPHGPANVTGLDLSYHQNEPARYGVYKAPVAAGRGSSGLRFSIEPGQPEKSFLLHRIRSTDLGVMMPTLGRSLADAEGTDLIAEWIQQIAPDTEAAERTLNPMVAFEGAHEQGNAELGRTLFYEKYQCVTCHTADQKEGATIGPLLAGIGSRMPRETILESIVAPSAQIAEGYAMVILTHDDDKVVAGRLQTEDDHTVILALPDGTTVSVNKSEITKRETSELSAMPSLAGVMTPEEAGALTAFLASLEES